MPETNKNGTKSSVPKKTVSSAPERNPAPITEPRSTDIVFIISENLFTI